MPGAQTHILSGQLLLVKQLTGEYPSEQLGSSSSVIRCAKSLKVELCLVKMLEF